MVVSPSVRSPRVTVSSFDGCFRHEVSVTVSVKVSFTNRKHPEDDFPDKSFSAYSDFDSSLSLDSMEAQLCDEIVEKLCEDIFNATVAQW